MGDWKKNLQEVMGDWGLGFFLPLSTVGLNSGVAYDIHLKCTSGETEHFYNKIII